MMPLGAKAPQAECVASHPCDTAFRAPRLGGRRWEGRGAQGGMGGLHARTATVPSRALRL